MDLHLQFETNPKLWRFGYCREFAQLGMATLIVGPAHLQLSCDMDRDDLCDALGSPLTALRTWLTDRLQFGRSPMAAGM